MDFKKRAGPLLVSLLAHALLLTAAGYWAREYLRAAGEAGNEGLVYVSLSPSLNTAEPKGRVRPVSARHLLVDEAGGEETGNGGEGGTEETLRLIRLKIERAKFYPFMAKRQGLEGKPEVEFQIEKDGTLKYVSLKQTSGHEELDLAALKTIRQSAPLPFYPDAISLAISYGLNAER